MKTRLIAFLLAILGLSIIVSKTLVINTVAFEGNDSIYDQNHRYIEAIDRGDLMKGISILCTKNPTYENKAYCFPTCYIRSKHYCI